MDPETIRLKPGTLWPAIVSRTRYAIARGALHPIATEQAVIEDGGVRFLVRCVSSLRRKDEDRRRRETPARRSDAAIDPFLPYEQDLFVADVSGTHLCLLNKFNVIDHHVLIVTRRFEHQETILTLRDFEALAACAAEFDGLGFHNGGKVAGASQIHKHLQMVPLPLTPEGPSVPIEPLLGSVQPRNGVGLVPGLPFRHAFVRLDPGLMSHPLDAAGVAHHHYRNMLDTVGLRAIEAAGEVRQSAPYNLLITRRWMLLVPRSQEYFDSTSINALGFAGSLFVRSQQDLQAIRHRGPMAVLRHVALE